MFLTIEVVGQSLILLSSAFQESEIYPCSQDFSLTMLSLARTLLPVAVCFQTKDNCPAHRGLEGHRGLSRGQRSTCSLGLELNEVPWD